MSQNNATALYTLPLDGAQFTALCGGNQGGDNETCMEIAPIPGAVDAFAVRDNKVEGGPVLRFTGAELRTALAQAGTIIGA
ncbi:DUF397 domain-containing protein [Streptomyces sp. KAU_LT]|uniref:DUF397 domain-containing protein n=1 Tax=Streptomyces sp. KAU_LT TaxID=3046669 RepID=UPI0024B84A36|nr:DUF397 domain-containing protein [Streptomyces sp. KAU_LT]MDI9829663.1 DUF397 domain-containing protein [Streptomyces sp. KAU_LT]